MESLGEELAGLAARGMTASLWARRKPGEIAIHDPLGTRTFFDLNANANRVARLLRERGLKEGDAVALLCSNRAEFVEVLCGCLRGGYRVTPVNWHLNADEVEYIINDCDAKALFAETPLSVRRRGQGAAGDAEGLDRRATRPASSPTRGCWPSSTARHHRSDAGLGDALHLRHHRPAQGRLSRATRCWPDDPDARRARRRAAVRRPRLPRRAAGVRRALGAWCMGNPAGVHRPLGQPRACWRRSRSTR